MTDPALLLIPLCVAASFLFSGTETAFFSLQKPERERLARGTPAERQAVWLLSRRAALITTLLLGNELANVLFTATAGGLLEGVFPGRPWLAVLVVTPVLVLVSEITPKVLAFRFRRLWTQLVAWPITAWFWIATPPRLVLSTVAGAVGRALGAVERQDTIHEEELLAYVGHGAASGELDPMERDIIEAVFEFDDITVERLMTPRPDVFSLPVNTAWPEILSLYKDKAVSRIPVTGHGPDDIVGVLLVKDLLKFRQEPLSGPRQLRSMLLAPVFVPASKPADSMLQEFLEKRFHMAFVVDEHGTFVGLVTLDDLLRELLGSTDEEEDEDSAIAHTRPDAMTVKASIDLEDLADQTGIRLPSGDFHTLGGFVFHQLGRLPRRGDSVTFGAHELVVSKMEGRRVSEIVIHSRTPEPTSRQGGPAPLDIPRSPPPEPTSHQGGAAPLDIARQAGAEQPPRAPTPPAPPRREDE